MGIVFVVSFSLLQLNGQGSAGALLQHRRRYLSRSPAVRWSHGHCARGEFRGRHTLFVLRFPHVSALDSVEHCMLGLGGVHGVVCGGDGSGVIQSLAMPCLSFLTAASTFMKRRTFKHRLCYWLSVLGFIGLNSAPPTPGVHRRLRSDA